MKTIQLFISVTLLLFVTSCAQNPLGKKIKDPFNGNSYKSNNRYWRSTGKGTSQDEQIAVKKARLNAKAELGSQVNTIVKSMGDQYLGSVEASSKAEITGKFQDLIRQSVLTEIADLRLIDEVKYQNDKGVFTAFSAYEIKKKSMYKHLKKQLKIENKSLSYKEKVIEDFLNEQIQKTEESEN